MNSQSKSLSALLEDALDQAPFGVKILDVHGRVMAANRRCGELLGRDAEQLVGAHVEELGRPSDRGWVRSYLAQIVSGEIGHLVTDVVAVLPDGRERPLQLTSWPLAHEGVCHGIVEILSPTAAPAGLADGRMRKLIENIDNTISLIDADGQLLETSGRYRPILGYPSEFWESRTIFDLLHPDDAARIVALREQVLADPGRLMEDEVRVRAVHGGYEPIHIAAVNLLDDPDVAGIVITSRNVSEERALTRELAERTERAETEALLRSRLIATVSHELRNPLHAMNGLAELLALSDLPSEVAVLAQTLHRQVAALTSVLDDLLESSSIDASGVELRTSSTPIEPLVRDLVALMSAVAESRPLSVRADIDESVPVAIDIDGNRLRQILSNLMGNAVKFTDAGSVVLRIEAVGALLRCTVTDTGRGIDPDEVESIFLPFTSARTGGTRTGAGLGLTIVRQLVTAMGGELAVTSVVGEGSTFAVSLPFTPTTDAALSVHSSAAARAATDADAVVLVVEDNPVNQLLAKNQLLRLGFSCVIAGTGEQALVLLAGPNPPGIVLMDFQLPGIDGLETTRRLRRAEQGERRAVVIGVTASAMAADRTECLAAGMDDFLPKPVGLIALEEMLAKWSIRTGDPDLAVPDSTANDELDTLVVELGDVGVVHQLIDTYLREVGNRSDDIVAAIGEADAERIRKGAHALRSSSYLLGLHELGDACRTLETAGAATSDSPSAQDLARLVSRAEDHLRSWIMANPVSPS